MTSAEASTMAPSSVAPLEATTANALVPFDFQPLTRVVFGAGALARLGDLVRDLGGRRILVVTDPGIWSAGHPQRAVQALQQAKLETFVFDGVEENPTTRHVDACVRFARERRVDFL